MSGQLPRTALQQQADAAGWSVSCRSIQFGSSGSQASRRGSHRHDEIAGTSQQNVADMLAAPPSARRKASG